MKKIILFISLLLLSISCISDNDNELYVSNDYGVTCGSITSPVSYYSITTNSDFYGICWQIYRVIDL
jgi:hypothetical protein